MLYKQGKSEGFDSRDPGLVILSYPPYPKDRGMLWFYVEAARRPQWC